MKGGGGGGAEGFVDIFGMTSYLFEGDRLAFDGALLVGVLAATVFVCTRVVSALVSFFSTL